MAGPHTNKTLCFCIEKGRGPLCLSLSIRPCDILFCGRMRRHFIGAVSCPCVCFFFVCGSLHFPHPTPTRGAEARAESAHPPLCVPDANTTSQKLPCASLFLWGFSTCFFSSLYIADSCTVRKIHADEGVGVGRPPSEPSTAKSAHSVRVRAVCAACDDDCWPFFARPPPSPLPRGQR
jgi:hypothetical protein